MTLPCQKRPQNHRILEQLELEGTFEGHLVEPLCNEQEQLQLDQVTQSPAQPDVECVQGCGIYRLSGQSIPVFYYPHCKKFLP